MKYANRLWALDSPTVTYSAATLTPGAIGEVEMPLPAFLIEHTRGLILFDTGISPEAFDDPLGVYAGEVGAHMAANLHASEDQRIDNQLKSLGFATSDVTHVVSSHLHLDHCGGHHLFQGAIFLAGAGEFRHALFPDPAQTYAFAQDQLQRMRSFDWRELPISDVDLFGDGSISILHTPGHTPGELSLKVRLSSRTFILTGDTVHSRGAFQMEYPYVGDTDSAASLNSIRRLKRIQEAEEATVWIAHDPEDWSAMNHAPLSFE